MINAQRLSQFREDRETISGFWKVGEAEAHGTLLWSDNSPKLILSLTLTHEVYIDPEELDHPIFLHSKPPLQPTIFGANHKYGVISLQNCFRTNVSGSTKIATGETAYELEFHITRIWIGDAFDSVEATVRHITLTDERVASIFGNPGLETYDFHQEQYKSVFEALGNPKTIWAVRGPAIKDIPLGDTGWTLSISTNAMTGSNAKTGRSINTAVQVYLDSDQDFSIYSSMQQIFNFEQIISVFSLEPFSFRYIVLETHQLSGVGLAWQIDDELDIFQPPMHHQILVDLSLPQVLEPICRQWFSPSETVNLSRWLFGKALAETRSGLSRFVTVSQAFEVLGREFGPNTKMTRSRLREAIDLIRKALSGNFEEQTVERWIKLIQSSNKASYQDVLRHMIEGAAAAHLQDAVPQIESFCKVSSDTRNAIIHMSDDDKGKLQTAFSRVNKLSLMLCFWYAVVQAHNLGLQIPNITGFLFNNRNARHGLPNEVLERAASRSRPRPVQTEAAEEDMTAKPTA